MSRDGAASIATLRDEQATHAPDRRDSDRSARARRDRVVLSSEPTATHGSVIYTNGKLYSPNQREPVYRSPRVSTEIVNHLSTGYSWFRCWKAGAPHDEGTLWYYTKGDHNDREGWVRGDRVNAPRDFEANPAAFGFMPCASP